MLSWRTEAMTARVIASSSSARPAADPATAPQAGVLRDRGRSRARAAGEQPRDLCRHAALELHVFAGPPLPVPFPTAHPGFLVGQALLLCVLERCVVHDEEIAAFSAALGAGQSLIGRITTRSDGLP